MTATTDRAASSHPDAKPERRRLGGRAGWILADQAVSSLANAGLSVVVARSVSPGEFGAFALAFSVYTVVVAVSQAMSGQVFSVRHSATTGRRLRSAMSGAAGTALAVGAVSAVLVGTVGALMAAPLRDVLLATAVLLPALTVQDAWRSIFIARGTPSRAFANDLLWTVLQIVLIGGLLAASVDRAGWYVVAWGVAALAGAGYGVRQAGARPSPAAAIRYVQANRDVSGPSVAGALAILGAMQVAFVLVAVVGDIRDVGALRAVGTLLGPLNIVGFAVAGFALPELARRLPPAKQLVMVAAGIGAALVVVDLTWGAIVLLLPTTVGVALLGQTWPHAQLALPGLITFTACIGATVGTTVVVRALARTRYAFATHAALGCLVIVGAVTGAQVDGARGAAWGLATAAAVMVVPCWLVMLRAIRLGHRPPPATSPDTPIGTADRVTHDERRP